MSAPPRVRSRIRSAPGGPVRVLHRGPDAVYVDVGGWCVGVLGRGAAAVPCAVRTSLATLPPVAGAAIRDGVLHLDETPLAIGRIVDVHVPRRPSAGEPGRVDVAGLVGRGDGLTPYGDDVLCGWLAAHRSAGIATPQVDAAVRAHLDRTTLLSATLLDCAMHGEVLPELGAFLRAFGTDAEDGAVSTLCAVGHSSGRGLLEGARLAMASLVAAA